MVRVRIVFWSGGVHSLLRSTQKFTMKMEAKRSSETLASYRNITGRHNPEYQHLNLYRRKNPKSRMT